MSEPTQGDVDLLRTQMTDILNTLGRNLEEADQEFKRRLESIEQTIAGLVVGYAEMAIMVEALLAQSGAGLPEQRQELLDHIKEGREQMFSILSEHTRDLAGSDPGLSSALQNVVDQKQSSTTD